MVIIQVFYTIRLMMMLAVAFLPLNAGSFMEWLSPTKDERVTEDFQGLRFSHHKDVICRGSSAQAHLSCTIYGKPLFGGTRPRAELVFKAGTYDKNDLALVRLNRKNQWLKQYSSLNQYVERPIQAGDFLVLLQEARYLRLNNSFWPVLIRAVDVVVNPRTAVSITILVDEFDWPLVEKEFDDILRTLSKVPVKR